MFFILLTFAAAMFIEGLGSLVSVIGISALFGANPIIIALAIALDVGKIVTVSLLYTYWARLSKLMKAYALLAAAVTMTITSTGAAGYLSGEFQKVIVGTKEGELKVSVYKEQQEKYQLRKKQIDDQIAALPSTTTVNQRLRLINGFKQEQQSLDSKIAELDRKLPEQQLAQIGTESHAGPILYVAKAFNISVEEAVKYVILMIIFVFDPLAIFLIIAGNFLWAARKREKLATTSKKEVVEKTPHEDDDVNNVYIDKDGVEHLPVMPQELKGPIVLEGADTDVKVMMPPSEPVNYDDLSPKITDRKSVYVEPSDPWPRRIPPMLDEPTEVLPDPVVEPEPPIFEHLIPTEQQVEAPETTLNQKLQDFQPEKHGGEFPPVDEVVASRPQITRSSLQGVTADPATVVDARRRDSFLPSKAFTTPTRKS